jgi:hypothetical protein
VLWFYVQALLAGVFAFNALLVALLLVQDARSAG